MRPNNLIVHTVWVGDRFSLMECLTVKLLQKHGHQVHLWAYQDIDNVPAGVVIRDASTILPEATIFGYTGTPLPGIPNDGIGSLAHWSDVFQMKLLELEGGVYSQLDVAYLAPLNFQDDYVFVPNAGCGVITFLMKCPRDSHFARKCAEDLIQTFNKDTISKFDWGCSMKRVYEHIANSIPDHNRFFIEQKNFLDLGGLTRGPFFEHVDLDQDIFIIHWSNATHNQRKDNPVPGAVYHRLLTEVGLV